MGERKVMVMRLVFYFVASFTLTTLLNAQPVKSYQITADFFPSDARMHDLPVAPDAFMRASAVTELREFSTDTIYFYLHGELTVDSILQDDKKVSFSIDKSLYYYNYSWIATKAAISSSEINSGKPFTIYYSGFFNPSGARSLSDYMRINKHEGVFLRSYGYSLWFPVFLNSGEDSYAADFRQITISVPENFKVLVTGELISEQVEGHNMTAVWQPGITDITELQCTARNYDMMDRENVYIYHINNEANGRKILDYAIALKKIYSRHLMKSEASVPLYIMEMPAYGNISSENVVGLTSEIFNDFEQELSSKLTIAHELVHPFVKIPISMNNPLYAFVVEGFPSFFQIYALKKLDAEFDLKGYMKQLETKYLKKRQSDRYPVEKAILLIKPDEIGTYKDKFVLNDRVWLFFYDLWVQMGADNFDDFLITLFQFDKIDYNRFADLILRFIPDYRNRLNIWLNTTEFTENMYID